MPVKGGPKRAQGGALWQVGAQRLPGKGLDSKGLNYLAKGLGAQELRAKEPPGAWALGG